MALVVKNPIASAQDLREARLIPELEGSSGGGLGNPLQYSRLKNSHEWRTLVGYSLCGHEESDTTEQLSAHAHTYPINVYRLASVIIPSVGE